MKLSDYTKGTIDKFAIGDVSFDISCVKKIIDIYDIIIGCMPFGTNVADKKLTVEFICEEGNRVTISTNVGMFVCVFVTDMDRCDIELENGIDLNGMLRVDDSDIISLKIFKDIEIVFNVEYCMNELRVSNITKNKIQNGMIHDKMRMHLLHIGIAIGLTRL